MSDTEPTQVQTKASEVSRPTKTSERTLAWALCMLCALALVYCAVIAFLNWPDAVARDRIHFLGWAMILAVGGIMLLVIAFISPWVGTVKATGMGASLEVDGNG